MNESKRKYRQKREIRYDNHYKLVKCDICGRWVSRLNQHKQEDHALSNKDIREIMRWLLDERTKAR